MLRADPALRHCAIIAFTAFSGDDYRDAAFAAGCDEFVTKPVAAAHLVGLVRQYARRIAPPPPAAGRESLTPSLPTPMSAPVPR